MFRSGPERFDALEIAPALHGASAETLVARGMPAADRALGKGELRRVAKTHQHVANAVRIVGVTQFIEQCLERSDVAPCWLARVKRRKEFCRVSQFLQRDAQLVGTRVIFALGTSPALSCLGMKLAQHLAREF